MDSWSKTSKNPADAELLHCILIVKGDASQILKKVSIALSYEIHLTSNFYRFNQSLKSYAPYHFEVFKQEELLVNITHHELVPVHMLLSDQEKDELLKR